MLSLRTKRLGRVLVDLSDDSEDLIRATVKGCSYGAIRVSSRAVFHVGRYMLKIDMPDEGNETQWEIKLSKTIKPHERKFFTLPLEHGRVRSSGDYLYWSLSRKHNFQREDKLSFNEQTNLSPIIDRYKLKDGLSYGGNTGVLSSGQIKIFDFGWNLFHP